MYHQKKSKWINFQNDTSPYSISENSLLSFLQDRSGAYWFGMTGRGISQLFPEHKKIQWIISNDKDLNSIGGNSINGIIEDHQGKIWISINGFGLDCLDMKAEKVQHYPANNKDPEKLISSTVVSLLEDHQGNIWVGTWGAGLECLNPKTGVFSHYQHDRNNPQSISANIITDIYEDDAHRLWIATWGGGLNCYDFNTQRFHHYRNDPEDPTTIRDNRLIDIYEDSEGILWVSLIAKGLQRFDRATEKFSHYTNIDDSNALLCNSTIHCLYEDRNHRFWLGTIARGLVRLNRKTGQIKCFTTREGLSSNWIAAILEDNFGNLWISTDNGLSCFNPTTENFRNYDSHDGLTSPGFNMRAACRSMNGKLYFGGNKGIYTFYPEDMKQNPFDPPIVFTDFQLFNQTVSVEPDSFLNRNIAYLNQLILTYEQKVFTLKFSALNYISPQKNQYAYHMSNVDNDWVYVDSFRPFATYTKLPYGNYTFKVKGSNNDGVWNEKGISLNIKILAPWWQTLWFKITVLLGILFLIILYFHIRYTRIKKREHHLELQVVQRTRELQRSNQQLIEEMDRFTAVMNSLN
jgi:ligand-binding sensor domain-containing protein